MEACIIIMMNVFISVYHPPANIMDGGTGGGGMVQKILTLLSNYYLFFFVSGELKGVKIT